MQVSASILGRDYGLTGEQMNRVLVKLGFLTGEPGAYTITEKAKDYVIENYHHRGTGGYSQYNAYWTTRTFDDSIKEVLNVTDELIAEVREELAAHRAAIRAERVEEVVEEAKEHIIIDEDALKKLAIGGAVIAGIVGVGYGTYKLAPRIKKWWVDRKVPEKDEETDEDPNND